MKGVFKSVAKGSFIITASRLAVKAISLVSVFVVTTALSRQDYGVLSLALTVSGPVLVLGGLGLDEIVLAMAARLRGEGKHAESRALLSGFGMVKVAVTAAVILLLIPAKQLLGDTYRVILEQFFLPLEVWIAATALRTLADTGVQAKERFFSFGVANIVEAAVKLGVVAFLFFTRHMDVGLVLWAYVAGKAASVLVMTPGLLAFVPHGSGVRNALRTFFRFVRERGKWEVGRAMIANAASGVDQWFIGLFAGLESVAAYSLALTMRSVLAQALPFRQVLYPILARMSAETSSSSFVARRVAKYAVWFNGALMILTAIAAPAVIGFFFPKYAASIPLLFALLPGLIWNALGTSQTPLLHALGEQRFIAANSMVGVISGLTLLPLLTFFFGVWGAVLEQHLSTVFIVAQRERRLGKRDARTFVVRDFISYDEYDANALLRMREGLMRRLPRGSIPN